MRFATYIPQTRRMMLLLLLALAGHLVSFALEPRTSLKQAQHTVWGLQDGAPNRIVDITQTTDGFLWLGSQTGLFRFDGEHFTKYGLPSDPGQSWDVTSVSAFENNELWVGTRRSGIVRYKDGTLVQAYSVSDGIPRSTVYSVRKDSRGTVWAATAAGVYVLRGDHWQRSWPANGLEPKPSANLWMDRSGTLCFTTDGAVVCKGAGSPSFSVALEGPVEDINLSPDGQIWVWLTGRGIRPLNNFDKTVGYLKIQIPHGHVVFIKSGDAFLLTYGKGLTHVFRGDVGNAYAKSENFSLEDGLQSSYLGALFEDREGNVWVGTTKGLERFRNGKFVAVNVLGASPSTALSPTIGSRMWAGLRTEPLGFVTATNQREAFAPAIVGVTATFRDSDESTWFGVSPMLWHVSKGRAQATRFPDWVQGSSDVQAITKDHHGALWVSVIRFGVLHLDNGHWTRFDSGSGTSDENATMLYTDDEGRVWMSFHGRVVMVEAATHPVFTAEDGLSFGDIMSFAGQGSLLAVGGEHGIGFLDGHRFKRIATNQDDVATNISGLVFSADGALWAHGSSALLRISREELTAFRSGKIEQVKAQRFTFADGLPGLAPLIRPLPSATLDQDGRLWVSTTSGVAWIDPLHYPKNPTPPPVVLQSIRADGHDYLPFRRLTLPALTKSVSFTYTAPSLSMADGVRFRYRLEGFDSDWQEAGTRRIAFYTGLAPGHYTFRVIAANEDLVWNDVGDVLAVDVTPAFYQTMYFKACCWLIGACVLWTLYRTRLRLATERVRDLLAERLAERERIAGELHDTLLQSVQGLILLFHGISVQIPEDNPLYERIDLAIGRAERLLEEGRDSVRDLRSTSFSLEDAFLGLTPEFQAVKPTYCVTVSGQQPELQLLVCDEVFKFGREAVRNALQHADADRVEVRIGFRPYELMVTVEDDGVGIPEDILREGRSGHWGLLGMRERAKKLCGTFAIRCAPGQGTRVELVLPADVAYRNSVPSAKVLLGMYWNQLTTWLRRPRNVMQHTKSHGGK